MGTPSVARTLPDNGVVCEADIFISEFCHCLALQIFKLSVPVCMSQHIYTNEII